MSAPGGVVWSDNKNRPQRVESSADEMAGNRSVYVSQHHRSSQFIFWAKNVSKKLTWAALPCFFFSARPKRRTSPTTKMQAVNVDTPKFHPLPEAYRTVVVVCGSFSCPGFRDSSGLWRRLLDRKLLTDVRGWHELSQDAVVEAR